MIKCLAIADLFIDREMMEEGLKDLATKGISVDIKEWRHSDLDSLQKDNIKIEKHGCDAVELPEYLLENIEEYQWIITQFAPIGKKVIERAENLELVGVLRAGTENVAVSYAEEKGIAVYNTPGRSKTSVSEFTVGLILTEIRNIARGNQKLREHQWQKYYPNGLLAPELKESTIGLIGYGEIGQRVAHLLRPFGCNILFFDDYFDGTSPGTQVSLEELVEKVDIFSMHYRLTPQTKHMINESHFKKMKPSAVFINSARAGLVNEQDLIQALRNKEITGAAVDVFEQEPLPADHPYLTLDNLTITPHIAGSTIGNFANSPKILVNRIFREYL